MSISNTPSKPNRGRIKASFLQRLASQVNWFIGYRLQFTHGAPRDLEVSELSKKLMNTHTNLVRQLKLSLRADYIAQAKRHNIKKAEAIAERKTNGYIPF